MKRVFILLAVSLFLAGRYATAQVPAPTGPPPAPPTNDVATVPATATNDPPAATTISAPTVTTAAAVAAQQAAEERYKRMTADIEALQSDNESLKTKVTSLEQKIDDLRQQLTAAAANNNNGVQEDLKRLTESIVAVDKKREEDKQAISEEIRKAIAGLEKNLAAVPTPIHEPSPKLKPDAEAPATADGYSYIVKDGQNLSIILKAYNDDYKSKGWKTISLKQAEDANPNVDWDHLRVGQKIIIPKPEGQ